MAQRKYSVEQIIIKLREIELLCNQGKTIAEAARQAGITERPITDGVRTMVA